MDFNFTTLELENILDRDAQLLYALNRVQYLKGIKQVYLGKTSWNINIIIKIQEQIVQQIIIKVI